MKAKKSDTSVWVVSSMLVITVLLNLAIFSIVFLGQCPQDAKNRHSVHSKPCERKVSEGQGLIFMLWESAKQVANP